VASRCDVMDVEAPYLPSASPQPLRCLPQRPPRPAVTLLALYWKGGEMDK
jgi:hypothetical protein